MFRCLELTWKTNTSTFSLTTLGEPSERVISFVDLWNINGQFTTIIIIFSYICNVSIWSTCVVYKNNVLQWYAGLSVVVVVVGVEREGPRAARFHHSSRLYQAPTFYWRAFKSILKWCLFLLLEEWFCTIHFWVLNLFKRNLETKLFFNL